MSAQQQHQYANSYCGVELNTTGKLLFAELNSGLVYYCLQQLSTGWICKDKK